MKVKPLNNTDSRVNAGNMSPQRYHLEYGYERPPIPNRPPRSLERSHSTYHVIENKPLPEPEEEYSAIDVSSDNKPEEMHISPNVYEPESPPPPPPFQPNEVVIEDPNIPTSLYDERAATHSSKTFPRNIILEIDLGFQVGECVPSVEIYCDSDPLVS